MRKLPDRFWDAVEKAAVSLQEQGVSPDDPEFKEKLGAAFHRQWYSLMNDEVEARKRARSSPGNPSTGNPESPGHST